MKKILWTTGLPLRKTVERLGIQGSESGTWLDTSFSNITKAMPENLFFVVHANNSVKKIIKFRDNNVEYFVIPRRRIAFLDNYKKELDILNLLIKQISPDLIDVQGTEEFYGLLTHPEKCKVIVSLQGNREQIYKQYFSDISRIKYYSIALKQLKLGVFVEAFLDPFYFKQKVKMEKAIILNNKYFTGRTFFDKCHTLGSNSKANYFSGFHRIMRRPFYENEWDINETLNYTLHTTVTAFSYKGIFLLIDTIEILKRTYKSIQVNVAGNLDNYIGEAAKKEVKRKGLSSNIFFLGHCTAYQIIGSMKKSRAFILCSFIENSPNSLQEAQCLGMPCIAAYTGGIPSIIDEGKTGLFYPPGDPWYLAGKIEELFNNFKLASELGKNARLIGLERNNSEKITLKYVDFYNKIMAEKK